ncbi:MAG: hypothetical protein IIY82_01015 [Firmicutes bacterium]|nr:hypothetical protein [Bacillota bacterium]
MRTSEERLAKMYQRAGELRQQRRNRTVLGLQAAVSGLTLTAVILLAVFLPRFAVGGDPGQIPDNLRASIFTESPMLSYVVIAVLAFLLGIMVTVFCFYLRKLQQGNDRETEQGDR